MVSKEEGKDKNNRNETGKENAAVNNGNGNGVEDEKEEEQLMQKFQERVDGRCVLNKIHRFWLVC
jgi:hypothetical protein